MITAAPWLQQKQKHTLDEKKIYGCIRTMAGTSFKMCEAIYFLFSELDYIGMVKCKYVSANDTLKAQLLRTTDLDLHVMIKN